MKSRIGRSAFSFAAFALSTAVFLVSPVHADTYPSKPIKIIVPLAVGGGQDIMTRVVAAHLSEKLGQQIVVENRPGGGGNIGMEAGARAAPDGYTLTTLNSGTMAINPFLYEAKLPVDPVKDFAPIMLLCRFYQYLIVHPSVPAKNLSELVGYARQNPGKLSAGHAGVGGISYFAIEQFYRKAGIDIISVPYKGAGPAITDLLGGQISMVFTDLAGARQPIASGGAIGMGVTAAQRRPVLPDIPAIGEVVPGYASDGWYGLLAPAGTPEAIVQLLNQKVAETLEHPTVKKRFAEADYETVGGTPEQFMQVVKSDMTKYEALVREYNIPKM